jgi:serine protease Do
MSRRILLMIALLSAAELSAAELRLEEIQKVAYTVKPAVVRVSSFATADFQYDAASVMLIEQSLISSGAQLSARALPDQSAVVETGAGGSGSGFIVHTDGFILTSGHVVAPTRDSAALERDLRRNGAIAALVKHFPLDQLRALYRSSELENAISALASAGSIRNVRTINRVELSNGEVLPFTIRKFSPSLAERGTDLALLQVSRRNLPVLQLGDSDTTRVGESIWAIGYPAVASSSDEVIGGWLSRDSDLEATFNPGTITAIKRDVMNTPVFQTNVAIYRGNSGGPAVNAAGEVIGVSSWGHKDVEQIKFLVPINVARKMLAEAGVKAEVTGAFNLSYRKALDDAANGRWSAARDGLDLAMRSFRNSPDLIRFRRDVERGIHSTPMWRQRPVILSAIVFLVAVAVVLASLWFASLRRRIESRASLPPTTRETLVAPEGATGLQQKLLGRFTILNGARAGERLGLGGSGIRIGRETTVCEIVLENPKVSRLHAEVVSIDGKVTLVDRNSSNGTYVNDQKIDRRVLRDGDIIYFGGRNAVAVAYHV